MIETMGTPGVRRPVTMVLVTDQFHCRRLIMAGRQLADREGASLEVVNVAAPGAERNPQAIEYLFQTSRDNDAVMTIHYSDRPERFLGELIQEQRPAAVVTGLPGEGSTLLRRLWMRFEKVDFYVVEHGGDLRLVNITDRAGLPALGTPLLPPALRLAES
ncbi:MAG: hypothetical protein HFF13_09205 [Angelakisella sp.]|jgi:hypothetical protein|nr:hypothetical protein [Angelakisella sp.]MCI9667414.1 hypothetical protein [Angelakisella sp.]